MTSTVEAARALHRRFPRLGRFIAVLDVPAGGPVVFEQTGREPTHYDLWGDAGDLLLMVVAVLPVEE